MGNNVEWLYVYCRYFVNVAGIRCTKHPLSNELRQKFEILFSVIETK